MSKGYLRKTLILVLTFFCLGVLLVRMQQSTIMHSRKKVDNLQFLVNKLNILCDGSPTNNSLCTSVRRIADIATKKRLYVRAWSRLGNHIFQYATLYGLAHKAGRVPVLVQGAAKDFLYMFDSISTPVIEELPPEVDVIQEEYSSTHDPRILQGIVNSDKDIEICCHFESFKYFLPEFADDIRRELVIRKSLRDDMTSYIHNLTVDYYADKKQPIPSKLTYIGVHIRRGDMSWIINGFNLPSSSYFYRAMDYYRRKYGPVLFVVMSQDKDWALQNIKTKDVVFSTRQKAYEDLTLLTLCNHTIGSVGTFSWWGGWLAGGEMIYFKDYYMPGTETDLKHRSEDIFLDKWIPMV